MDENHPDDSLPGRVFLGRYRVLGEIGRGGMGVVYDAEDTESGERVAIKTLRPRTPEAGELAARFQREAHAQSLLNHPHIVEVRTMGGLPDGTLFLIMERVAGEAVDELIRARAIGPRRALVICRQVLQALYHAHQHGMIHRDLKPENIMLVRSGEPGREYDQVKLLDFGLVKMIGDMAAGMDFEKLTRTGIVYGTPAYMAPEQALGRPLDGRTDIYSLGATLFEMLTGRIPFDDPDPMQMVRMHVTMPAPRLAQVAPGQPFCTAQMEVLLSGALAKQPEHRFPDARAMIAALDDAFLSLSHLPAEDY